MTRFGRVAWLLLVLSLAFGWTRLRFDVEVLDLLPDTIPSVQGLRLYQREFANTRELIITVESAEASATEEAASSLAETLRNTASLASEVTWQPPWQEYPADAAQFIAYLWLNQPPPAVDALARRLHPRAAADSLRLARDELATGLSPDGLARAGYDPLGLTSVQTPAQGLLPGNPDAQGFFASPDGTFRVLFVQTQGGLRDYRACVDWFGRVAATVRHWQSQQDPANPIRVGFTGQPAFMAEIGGGMERDFVRSVGGTVFVVGLLFWLAHRRWKPLFQVLLMLALILGTTLGLGGLVFGKLNVLSVGFAAMLLGLVADYALVLYQESRYHPRWSTTAVRRAVAPGILWAALTTACAFLAIALARFPGLIQLGLLVGLGILTGAGLMLLVFLPWVHGNQPDLGPTAAQAPQPSPQHHRLAWIATLVLLGAASLFLPWNWPAVDPSTKALRPTHSAAHATLEHLKQQLGQTTEPTWLLLRESTDTDMIGRLASAQAQLEKAREAGSISAWTLPAGLWPHPEWQHLNRPVLAAIANQEADLKTIAAQEGFTAHSLALAEGVFATWRNAGGDAGQVWWPSNRVTRWVLDRFATRTTPPFHALGLVYPTPTHRTTAQLAPGLAQTGHAWLTSWDQLGYDLLQHIRQDLLTIVPIVAALILTTLLLAFRRLTEILLALVALGLSLLLLQTWMGLVGWSWNLMNFVAVPLLLGAGVDYSLHMQLALRRHQGNLHATHQTVGRALLLCGATTFTGFASLAWSSNAGLAGLGRVCAAGIACITLVAVFLLPTWWHRFTHPHPARARPEPGQQPSRFYRAEAWRLGLVAARLIPAAWLQRVATTIARAYWLLAPSRREIVIQNMLPLVDLDPARARTTARRLYRNFALKLVDLWHYESGHNIQDRFGQLVGEEAFNAALASHRGLLLVTPHLGNWEFGAPLLARRGINILALSLAEPHAPLTELRKRARSRHGIETLVIRQDPFAFLEVIRRLERGETVALLIDRPPASLATPVQVCGHTLHASLAPAELARATHCLIHPVHLLQNPQGKLDAVILPAVDYDRAALRDPAARHALAGAILRQFEPPLRQHPDQWYHFVPIWHPTTRPES